MNLTPPCFETAADKLAALFDTPFGGKPKGRFRISNKLLRQIFQRRRLYDDDIRQLTRSLLERGYILVDMDSFFVVLSANSFVNYRRANEESLR
ncbi:hypothetical protein [Maricaulis salignorans]|uniref:Uncharacterized protein n=1 Tax=Maricaulis salignorans TaxID=144026 RepID=A0A1G9M4F4_9PROT|nr:hypothetical protein [Maricaulis salignorans]SDL68821.1 hypothetical protein SAMN04488568_101313 [Maricaulis salignorans]